MNDRELEALTRRARRALRNDDLAQEAVISTWLKSTTEVDLDVSKYANGTIRHLRADGISQKIAARKVTDIDDNQATTDTYSIVDWERIPDGLKTTAAQILQGYTLTEIAELQRTTPTALRMRLSRYRNKLGNNPSLRIPRSA